MGIWGYHVTANDSASDYYGALVERLMQDLEDAIENNRREDMFATLTILRRIGSDWGHIPIPTSRWKSLHEFFLEDAKAWEQRSLRIDEVNRVFDIPCYEPSDAEYDEFYVDADSAVETKTVLTV